ncbi:MAG: DEAD/DEAH box helicase [Kiritimatiellae bacterium]|nr:DEAD/DEAH box helicase [Kiritimatiellia bacterium]
MSESKKFVIESLAGFELWIMYLFVFGKGEWRISDLSHKIYTLFASELSASQANEICSRLARKGLLECAANYATVIARRYRLCSRFSFVASKWLLENTRKAIRPFARPPEMEMLYSLLNGGAGFVTPKDNARGNVSLWNAVTQFADMQEEAKSIIGIKFPPDTPARVYRILTSVLFCHGIRIESVFSDWYARLAAGGRNLNLCDEDRIEFAALCVWTGHKEWLSVLDKQDGTVAKEVDSFVQGCRSLIEGDLETAYKRMTGLVNFFPESRAVTTFSTPAAHLLALAVTVFQKQAKSRVERLAQKFYSYPREYSYGSEEFFYARDYEVSRSLKSYIGIRMQETEELQRMSGYYPSSNPYLVQWESPTCRSGIPFQVMLGNMTKDEMMEYVPVVLRLAEKAFLNGYPTLAGIYLSVFGWTFKGADGEAASQMAESLSGMGGIWFRKYETDSGAWKLVVAAFDKCLPQLGKTKQAARAKTGRIVWWIRFYDPQESEQDATRNPCLTCSSLVPAFRGPRSADDGSSDRELTFRAFLSGKYDSVITETDRAVFTALQKADCTTRYHQVIPADALEALCGHDCLVRRNYDYRSSGNKFTPISLVRRDVPLAVRSTVDGGLEISVETWCQQVQDDYVIRKLSESEYAFYAFPKATRAAIEVFGSYGENGMIAIPKNGVDAMRPLLPRMATLAPIQGDLAAVGGGADLQRVAGNHTPLLRIEFEEGVLTIDLKVKPLDDSDLVFVPGVGQPERMVSLRRQMVVLVRDLAAEKAAATEVRSALEDFASWSEDDCLWRIDSLLYALKALAALKELGEAVRLEWRKGKRLSVATPKPGDWKLDAKGGADFWFSVNGSFPLDNEKRLSITELIAAFRNRQGEFVPFGDGEYVRLTAALTKRLEALEAAGRINGKVLEVPPAAIPMLDHVFEDGAEDGLSLPQSILERAATIREAFARKVEPPARLKAELRPYQQTGYEWLSRLASCGFGSCLADDMGLGKTVQIITLLLERARDGASLVVAPASVCGNWRNEIARFAPTLRTVMAWDEKADEMDAVKSAGAGDVVIAGYGLVVAREAQFTAIAWNGVVLDEAQAIKNETSKRARAVKRLRSKFRVAATGTPVENRLSELWSISDFLNPGLLGPIRNFAQRFTADGRATPALKRLVSPLVLRRVKREVVEDLPEKTEITLPVILGDEERAGYETCRQLALQTLEAGGSENRISILAELTRLRRYCCHPSLVLGNAAKTSAKMDALIELLENLKENRHRALVFSQFTDYLAIVREAIQKEGWTHLYLDGQTPAAERERLVNAFQHGEGDFFLISLRAGGLGLNLTAANYVILLDPWWNPAVENQAADRAHRIGQKNPVTVYRLIASDTVEERVLDLHREKKEIAEDVLGGTASTALTPDELMKLFQ